MSYSGEHSVDYTNTNPDYWAGVNEYFKTNTENQQGETGIWIPNLEKQGAEATALAASAGGVTATGGSNYAAGAQSAGTRRYGNPDGTLGGFENTRAEYQVERPIKTASIYRGGTEYEQTDAGDTYGGGTQLGRMGTLPSSWQGAYLQGGQVTDRPFGANYTAAGGDFTNLLPSGTQLNNTFLDAILGPRDSDGMRIRGTYPGGSAPPAGTDMGQNLPGATITPGGASGSSTLGIPGFIPPEMGGISAASTASHWMENILRTDSPLFKGLQTRALQVANSMGIPLRSSMAQGLVMKALMDGVGPYAQQAANIFNQQQQLNQGYSNEYRTLLNNLYAKELMAKLGLTYDWYGKQLAANTGMWNSLLGSVTQTVNNPDHTAGSANLALGQINQFYPPGGINTTMMPPGLLG
jgi:hypothetical protein|tara:strand:- start:45 stop:1271 length:1227 start_codon:yes stop_codon:yes gene_type:complete